MKESDNMDYGTIFIILIIIVIAIGLLMYHFDRKKYGGNSHDPKDNSKIIHSENEENIIDVQNENDLEQTENN